MLVKFATWEDSNEVKQGIRHYLTVKAQNSEECVMRGFIHCKIIVWHSAFLLSICGRNYCRITVNVSFKLNS